MAGEQLPAIPWSAAGWRRLFWSATACLLASLCAARAEAQAPGVRRGAGRAVSNAGVEAQPDAARPEVREDGPRPLPAVPQVPAVLPGGFQPEQLVSPGGLSSTLNMLIVMTVLSLAPSILMMTTSFVRFLIVFGLLRQAMGTQQLPPNQVLIALSLFMTFTVMGPVWQQSYEQGIRPYTHPAANQPQPTLEQTFQATVRPLRRHMSEQIEKTGNSESVWVFLDFQKPAGEPAVHPETYDDVPLTALLPAYLLSEMKTAFIIGFQLYLPFLVIDMVVSSILMSMGMMMLPPTLISFPFKLLLFVLIDGWYLVVGMMLESVRLT